MSSMLWGEFSIRLQYAGELKIRLRYTGEFSIRPYQRRIENSPHNNKSKGMKKESVQYRRNLPHILPPGATYFVTYRLHGSIPRHKSQEWESVFTKQKTAILAQPLHPDIQREEIYKLQKKQFVEMDDWLDANPNGPYWLQEDKVAKEVADSLYFLANRDFNLWAFCIMSNHVHALLTPFESAPLLFKIFQNHKRHTGNRGNKVLGRSGAFWQHESFDHYVRDDREFDRIVAYIANNPVKAGIVENWQDWKWTYLHPDLL